MTNVIYLQNVVNLEFRFEKEKYYYNIFNYILIPF